jgi:hypothetical protein
MTLTFVSAFINLNEDRSTDMSIEKRFDYFCELASSGIPIYLFLSNCYKDIYNEKCNSFTNVNVIYIELNDLDLYKNVEGCTVNMPIERKPQKDSLKYMILMNSKIEFIYRVMQITNTLHYSWIDFSVFYIFKSKKLIINNLKYLSQLSYIDNCLFIPGCLNKGDEKDNIFLKINWRFCGGFFIGDRNSLEKFYDIYCESFKDIILNNGLTWEVNIWHYLELIGKISPIWIKSDHNDTLLNIPKELIKNYNLA